MGERRFSRGGLLLLLGLLPALAIGAFLAARDASHAAPPPPPPAARIAASLLPATAIPTSLPPTMTATKPVPTATATAPAAASSPTLIPAATHTPPRTATPGPSPTIPPTAIAEPPPATAPLTASAPSPPPAPTRHPTDTPTTPPARTWVEIGRWRDSDVIYTASFTVRGPWRIRWQLASPTESCQVMIVDGGASPLLTGPAGATSGVFNLPDGGTYSLMLHNTIPYEIVVEDFR